MAIPDPRVQARLRSAFGALYDTLIEEAPERAAWSHLGLGAVESAMDRARQRVDDPGIALGFRTLLKQELDAACDLTPAIMPFEASSLPVERSVLQRVLRDDERTREREHAQEQRRKDLWAQARSLMTRDGE